MKPRYQHTQYATWTMALLALILAGTTPLLWLEKAYGALVFTWAILLLVATQMWRMTVTVRDQKVILVSGTGHLKKTIDLKDVAAAEPVRNRWWYGWGLRWYPGGWLISISGLDAVEFRFREGRSLRVGTDDPWCLADAIQAELES